MSEADRARVEGLLETVRGEIEAVGRARRERAALTATASREGGRVSVVVDADGVVTQTRFASDVDELSYDEIAAAVTEAAREAAAEVSRRGREVMASMRGGKSRLPDFSEIAAGVPDMAAIREILPAWMDGVVESDSDPDERSGSSDGPLGRAW